MRFIRSRFYQYWHSTCRFIKFFLGTIVNWVYHFCFILLRCMQCRRDLAMRILSVCLSKRVHCDKTEERSVQIFIPYERIFSLVFWEEEWLVGATASTWNFGSAAPPTWGEIADFQPIFACSASAVTPIEKKLQLTLGSLLRAFQWA